MAKDVIIKEKPPTTSVPLLMLPVPGPKKISLKNTPYFDVPYLNPHLHFFLKETEVVRQGDEYFYGDRWFITDKWKWGMEAGSELAYRRRR